jgi:hypothetical protein
VAADDSAEVIRNRQLRQVDWRFFLTDHTPSRCVCWAGSSLAASLRRVTRELCTLPRPDVTAWDLVVDSEPVQPRIENAYALLRAGGEYAVRWDSIGPVARGRIRRRLERVGFRDVRFYWAWPVSSSRLPAFWLRVDRSRTFSWLVRSRQHRRTLSARLRAAVLIATGEVARRTGLLRPVWVLARKPGRLEPVDASAVVLLTGGHRSINKVVALRANHPQSAPDTVVKMARTPEARAGLVHEARILSTLPPIPGVPRLVHFDRGRCELAETLLTGEPLLARLDQRTLASVCERATGWLRDLARATLSTASANRVDSISTAFEEQWAAILEPGDLRAAHALLEPIRALPSVCEHRDFAPWNLSLGGRGELLVLDWESAEAGGVPGLDLVYFLAYAGFFANGTMRNGEFRSAYAAMLNPETALGALRQACLEQYLRALHLSVDLHPALGLLTWMVHARSEYQRILEDSAAPPTLDRLRTGVFWQLWQEEVRRAI